MASLAIFLAAGETVVSILVLGGCLLIFFSSWASFKISGSSSNLSIGSSFLIIVFVFFGFITFSSLRIFGSSLVFCLGGV